LGAVFTNRSFLTFVATVLCRLSFAKASCTFFQNETDEKLFADLGIKSKKALIVKGSGVDTEYLKSQNESVADYDFLMIGRILKDKGVVEFLEAARKLREFNSEIRLSLVGGFDPGNPSEIKQQGFNNWLNESGVEYLGETQDIKAVIESARIIVLPSYREGLSRALIEGASMSRPLVTTNVPGCRDVVLDGENGYLCEARNSEDLYLKMKKIFSLSPEALREMGRLSRERAETIFSEKVINDAIFEEITSQLGI